MRGPLDGFWAVVAWHVGLGFVVTVSWGCVGMLGALVLDDAVGANESAVTIAIDASTAEALVEIKGEKPFPASFTATVAGQDLVAKGGILSARTPRRRGYKILLSPGYFGSYSIQVRAPKPLRRLYVTSAPPETFTLVAETDDPTTATAYELEAVGDAAGSAPVATRRGIEIPLDNPPRRPFRTCLVARHRRDARRAGNGSRIDGPLQIDVKLGCVTAKAD